MEPLLTEWIFQQGADVAADTLLVFGTAHHQPEFAESIVAIWREKKLRHIIISGHDGEAAQLARLACQRGVPEHLLILECSASNTLENVLFSKTLLLERCGGPALYLLCKRHAAARCLRTAATIFPDWTLFAYTVDYFGVDRGNWHRHRPFFDKARAELAKTLKYIGSGDIAAPASPSVGQLAAALNDMDAAVAAGAGEWWSD